MKAIVTILFLAFGSLILRAEALPTRVLIEGNAYWSSLLGVQTSPPKVLKYNDVSAPKAIAPDAGLQLIHAALQFKVSEISSTEARRFADTSLHVLVYLSGGSPAAADHYNRAGWWQLSYPVAVRYGLKITDEVDERFDFERATVAAMHYAQDLQKAFNEMPHEWLIAFVRSPLAVSRPNGAKANVQLVRQLTAVKLVLEANHPDEVFTETVTDFFNKTDNFQSKKAMLVDLLIEQIGMEKSQFYLLNPLLRGEVIPQKAKILLPKNAIAAVVKNEADIWMLTETRLANKADKQARSRDKLAANQPKQNQLQSTTYSVKRGDNLGLIAERFDVSVSDLKEWNNLRSDLIYAGQKLLVYGQNRQPQKPKQTEQKSVSEKKETTKTERLNFEKGTYVSYRVKSGDTLWDIASKFPGVSADNIMAWNGISNHIEVGQIIKIPKKEIRDYSPSSYPDSL